MNLRSILDLCMTVTDSTFDKISEVTELRSVKKGECVIEQGKRDDIFLFISKGIFRMKFIANGKERTIAFGCPGDLLTSVSTYMNNSPSMFSFEAVTDGKIYQTTHSEIRTLIATDPAFSQWMLQYMFDQLNAICNKVMILGTLNATQQYKVCVADRPIIGRNVPSKYIAQYLGIAPETLCRIQAALAKKKS